MLCLYCICIQLNNKNFPHNWATSCENVFSEIFDQIDSNQPAHLQKLARILKLWIYQVYIYFCLSREQQRCWSDCADAQADLHLCCSHMAHTFPHDLAHMALILNFHCNKQSKIQRKWTQNYFLNVSPLDCRPKKTLLPPPGNFADIVYL